MSAAEIIRSELAARANNSPVLRTNRLHTRERVSSVDLPSLRLDALQRDDPINIYSAIERGTGANVSSRVSGDGHDTDSDDEAAGKPLLPQRTSSNRGISPGLAPRTLTVSGGVNDSVPTASPALITLSQTQSSLPPLPPSLQSPEFSSPSHGHGYSRARSSSFSFVNILPTSPGHSFNNIHSLQSLKLYLHNLALTQLKFHLLRSLVLATIFLFSLFLLWIDWRGKCDMSSNLAPLLLYTVRVFNQHDVDYWADYGTLLGGARTNTIIPHEFDVDLSSTLGECDKILALKPYFTPAQGYRMYGRDDWVPEKASFLFGYGGYLHKPCVRIYDLKTSYYVDVDWHIRLNAAELPDAPLPLDSPSPADVPAQSLYGTVYLPAGYHSADGDVWCNEEGFNGHDPGGCRRDADLFPLTTIDMYGEPVRVPHNSDRVLKDMYGDSWRVPRPKGYKLLFCSALPKRPWLHILLAVLYIGLPLTVYAINKGDKRLSAMWNAHSTMPGSRR